MSHESTFVQQNNAVSLLNQLSNDLKNIANQPNSIAAFFVARQLNHRIDEILKKQADDNSFITALVFQATEQNDILFLKLLLQRMERRFGKSALYRFLNGHNDQKLSLLVFAVSHGCSAETIEYLTNTVGIPITEQVIFSALFAQAIPALNYFMRQGDTEDLLQNKLLRLSNMVDAYIKEYGSDSVCEEYKSQINTRLIQRNLTLTFEKKEVPVIPQPPKSTPAPVSTLSQLTAQQKYAANALKRLEITTAITQTESKLAQLKTTLCDVKRQQHDVTLALTHISITKTYLAAEDTLKEPLSWSQRIRLAVADKNNFLTRAINWCLDYAGTSTLEKCQHKQTALEKSQQIVASHNAVAKEVYKTFCKPNKQLLTTENLQTIEKELLQKKQKLISQRKVLDDQQTDISEQLSELRHTLHALDQQAQALLATAPPLEEMANNSIEHGQRNTPQLN